MQNESGEGKTQERYMERREAELAAVGIHLTSAEGRNGSSFAFSEVSTNSTFSGYGEFTPITVRSDTVLLNADVERNKRRD